MAKQQKRISHPTPVALPERIGRFRPDSFLGRGGFALVYGAIDPKDGRRVALKCGAQNGGGSWIDLLEEVTDTRFPNAISPDECPADAWRFEGGRPVYDLVDAAEIDRMLRAEARTLEALNTEPSRVVRLHEVIHDAANRPVLVLEQAKGKTLRERMRNHEGININWFLQLVRELERLRVTGKLPFHGDLKPENIMVDRVNHSRSLDQLLLLDPSCGKDTDFIPLTAAYNPLLLRSSQADMMAIGVMLYEILTGRFPFDGKPWEYAGEKIVGETMRLEMSYFLAYPRIEGFNPNAPPELIRIVNRCLRDPEYDLPKLGEDFITFLKGKK